MSLKTILLLVAVTAFALAFIMPPINKTPKGNDDWTAAHERELQTKNPSIRPDELGQHKKTVNWDWQAKLYATNGK